MNSIGKTPARGRNRGASTHVLAYVCALAHACASAGDRARIRTHAFAFTLAFALLLALTASRSCRLLGLVERRLGSLHHLRAVNQRVRGLKPPGCNHRHRRIPRAGVQAAGERAVPCDGRHRERVVRRVPGATAPTCAARSTLSRRIRSALRKTSSRPSRRTTCAQPAMPAIPRGTSTC